MGALFLRVQVKHKLRQAEKPLSLEDIADRLGDEAKDTKALQAVLNDLVLTDVIKVERETALEKDYTPATPLSEVVTVF